jgi:hypothetical protein
MLVPLLNCTINEQYVLILFLVEIFQKLKFELLHLSLYSVDLIVWTGEKNYYIVADFQDVRKGVLLSTKKLVDYCTGSLV